MGKLPSRAPARNLALFSFKEMYSNRLLYLQTGDTLSPAGSLHHYCKDHLGHWEMDGKYHKGNKCYRRYSRTGPAGSR